jgi:hypothetical protein
MSHGSAIPLRDVLVVVFAVVAVFHLRHLRTQHRRLRAWHSLHVVMAVGMIAMLLASDVRQLAALFGAIALGVGGFSVSRLVRGNQSGLLWLIVAADTAAMVYMLVMPMNPPIWLTIVIAAWFVVQATGWITGRLRGIQLAGTVDSPQSAAPALGPSSRTSLGVASAGMAYMVVAMQFSMGATGAMPGMASNMPGMNSMPGMGGGSGKNTMPGMAGGPGMNSGPGMAAMPAGTGPMSTMDSPRIKSMSDMGTVSSVRMSRMKTPAPPGMAAGMSGAGTAAANQPIVLMGITTSMPVTTPVTGKPAKVSAPGPAPDNRDRDRGRDRDRNRGCSGLGHPQPGQARDSDNGFKTKHPAESKPDQRPERGTRHAGSHEAGEHGA